MSLTHPKMFHTGKRHYRINPSRHEHSSDLTVPVGHLEEEMEDGLNELPDQDFTESPDLEILQEGNNFVCRLRVPTMFHGFVVGRQHATLKTMEKEFNCQIKIPSRSSGSCEILLKSTNQFNIRNACRRIRWLEYKARGLSRPTHFFSMRANMSPVQSAFETFREKALELAQGDTVGDFRGVVPDVFYSSEHLHFTIAVLLLADVTEVSTTCDLLKEFVQSVEGLSLLADGPFKLTIQGLQFMNDDPSSVDVLYAEVRYTGRLHHSDLPNMVCTCGIQSLAGDHTASG
ncbi:unnamed protein product [Echinostoma caproni]|uniref:KH domain-containing protein n=1 Tax=Echinostoma caproni TaxID=27848 RepID=A0A183BA65_9TREM|nr:unnamed protein product [Echinostoma caproni]